MNSELSGVTEVTEQSCEFRSTGGDGDLADSTSQELDLGAFPRRASPAGGSSQNRELNTHIGEFVDFLSIDKTILIDYISPPRGTEKPFRYFFLFNDLRREVSVMTRERVKGLDLSIEVIEARYAPSMLIGEDAIACCCNCNCCCDLEEGL